MNIDAIKRDYHNHLKVACEFLTETKTKSDYVLDLYYQHEDKEFEDLSILETNTQQAQKIEMKLLAKKNEIQLIKSRLTNIKNEKFKHQLADFIQWIFFNSDPPSLYTNRYPPDLKGLLSKVKRYDADLIMLTDDVNQKFKNITV